MKLRVVTNSQMEAFRRCPRLHFFRYVLRRRPIVAAEPLILGTLIHAGLESWFGALKDPSEKAFSSPLDFALIRIATAYDRMRVNEPLLKVQAEELMLGYHCRWIEEDVEVLGVEQKFLCDVVDPILGDSIGVKLGGKLDVALRIGGGQYMGEHKSSSFDLDPGSVFWEKTKMSSQLGLYFVGGRSIGYEFDGVVYDVIGKPKDAEPKRFTPPEKRRYTKAGQLYKGQSDRDEDPSEYRERLRFAIRNEPSRFYARQVVVRLKHEVIEAVADLAATVEMMRVCADRGIHPRNPDSCFLFNRPCDYWTTCVGESDIRDDTRFRTARVEHEELED